MGDILLVSKPVVPPWNDSSKNLVRDLARHLSGHRLHVMVCTGAPAEPLGDAHQEHVYGRPRAFAPAPVDHARVLGRLLLGPAPDILHFFFAPNPKTSGAARLCVRARRRPSIQTVCSAPSEQYAPSRVLFGDRIVVLSRHTWSRFVDAGIPEERLVQIPPCIPAHPAPEDIRLRAVRRQHQLPEGAPILVYPGDLEFSAGADRSLEALADCGHGAHLVIASRAKTRRAHERAVVLQERAQALGIGGRVSFAGEVTDMHALLALATVVLLPAETLYAKMDLPLAVLEAMLFERPVVVLKGSPAAELTVQGGAQAVAAERDAIGEVVSRLLEDVEGRRELGRRARAQVLKDHAPSTMAERYRMLYDALT
ncbi:MAG: glycosyltransferase family 4 protein [Myxococcales bacterium]|nr:glycosyltransferase family 4 protein [Myxococcales bacterium]